jgi:predicted GIY-YIG superfamily endonuclease
MVNYENAKIYKIVCNITGKVYIGSTTKRHLSGRLTQHVYDAKRNINITSKQIILNGDYDIVLIELYPCKSKDELRARERHYIETMECVNKCIPNRTKAEHALVYYQRNKEKIKQYRAEYRAKNREQINKKQKSNYQKIKNKNDENNI